MASIIEGYLGKRIDGTKSRMPARLDRWQSLSGLVLGVFILGHLFFTASILLGKRAMEAESRFFEGAWLFGEPQPFLVGIMATIVFGIFVVHAALAMRKFPYKWREYKMLKTHAFALRHTDTNLWMVQALTGFVMFFLGSVHLWHMITRPDTIGPVASSLRVYDEGGVWLYGALLVTVVAHAFIGLYRLHLKWGIPATRDPRRTRRLAKRVLWGSMVAFLLMGYGALGRYWSLGAAHHHIPAPIAVKKVAP
jgi:fumarate reductase subunit C